MSRRKASKKANRSEFEDRLAEVEGLSDTDLKRELQSRGFKPGPIVATTRAVYERKLADLLLQPEQEGATEEDEADGSQEEMVNEGDSQEDKDQYSDSDVDENTPDTLLLTDSSGTRESLSSYRSSSSYKSQVTRLMDQESSSKTRQRSVTPKRKAETASTVTQKTVISQRKEEKKESKKPLIPIWLQILIFLLVTAFLVLVWYNMETAQSGKNLVTDG
ncbi:emerin homolog 1-like isoform X2 [Acanthaster planci]|uniref:Emerin homolog 1-like isoform X2 n=1 Tax=Acanthaster planci TaxID=133434 RepID=A0A8B7XKE5_ACAPL|nr:emerin homolog 1-like isoform X2 [Acanthaster planci]